MLEASKKRPQETELVTPPKHDRPEARRPKVSPSCSSMTMARTRKLRTLGLVVGAHAVFPQRAGCPGAV